MACAEELVETKNSTEDRINRARKTHATGRRTPAGLRRHWAPHDGVLSLHPFKRKSCHSSLMAHIPCSESTTYYYNVWSVLFFSRFAYCKQTRTEHVQRARVAVFWVVWRPPKNATGVCMYVCEPASGLFEVVKTVFQARRVQHSSFCKSNKRAPKRAGAHSSQPTTLTFYVVCREMPGALWLEYKRCCRPSGAQHGETYRCDRNKPVGGCQTRAHAGTRKRNSREHSKARRRCPRKRGRNAAVCA